MIFHNRTQNLTAALFASFLISVLFLTACKSTEPASETDTPDAPSIEEPTTEQETEATEPVTEADIDSILSGMSLEEKVGQLFVVRTPASFLNEQSPEYLRFTRLINNYHVGGLIFFRGDIYSQAVLTNKFQSMSDLPLWITQDMEFGAAMRVQGTTRFTPAMGIAATGNPENAFVKGQVTAREAKALGVHQVFAPVLDVNNNPQNPVINVRSFSADPEIVAEFGQAFIEGIESEGVLATAKHFPGHGDTDVDSHLALPTITHDYDRLNSIELVPFRATINNGLRSIMSAHIAFPNISENTGLPTTMDESILHRILVDSLNFDGLVVTDGLEMQGITNHHSPGEAVVMALNAGADMMLVSPDVETAIDEMIKAVQTGRITEERLDRSVRKILELKKEYGVFDNRFVDTEALSREIFTPQYRSAANEIARQSITVLKNENNVLPIDEQKYENILLVAVSDGRSGTTGNSLARELRNYHSNVKFHTLDRRSGTEEITDILTDADNADLIIIGSFIMVRSHHPMQMPEELMNVITQIKSRDKPTILTAFGNPYVVQDMPGVDAHVMAWSSDSNQVQQTVPALFGASEIRGRFTGTVPDMYEIGDGLDFDHTVVRLDIPEASGLRSDSLVNIDMIMQEAINDSVFPGGVVGVMRNGALVWHEGYGYHDYSKTRSVDRNDIYDLASLTKVMSTTTSIMKLSDEGKINLSDQVHQYIDEFNNGEKRNITIEHLLLHTSGLPAFRIYVDEIQDRSELIDAVRNEPLEAAPGEKYTYSDLGFILLAEIVEEVSGMRVDRFAQENIFGPMNMRSTRFNPRSAGSWITRRIPPTEIDTVYNRGTVHGYAHDERAYFMDGIAGHAGLFSSARDISAYAFMMLNDGVYGEHQILSAETIDLFTRRQSPINHRGFGFDRKSEDFSSAGTLTGIRSFGHLGFTGTSLWVDPDEEIAIILLTNRTYPYRSYGGNISRVRAEIADAVMRSIEK